MVSKARLDLPEPDSPVNTINLSRGRSTLMLRRLCSRAPRTMILSAIRSEPICCSVGSSSRVSELATKVVDLIAESCCVREPELHRCFVHLLFQRLNEPSQLLLRQTPELPLHSVALADAATILARDRRRVVRSQQRQDVADGLADRLRVDAVGLVLGELHFAAPLCFVDRSRHRV